MPNGLKALFAKGLNYTHLSALLIIVGLIAFGTVALFPGLVTGLVPSLEPYARTPLARWGGAVVFAIPAGAALWTFFAQSRALFIESMVIEQIDESIDQLTGSEGLRLTESFERSGLAGRDENARHKLLQTSSGRLAKRVFDDVKALRFDPIASIVDFQKGEVLGWSTRVMSYQSIAVRGGVLGTFFGLIASLANLPDILNRQSGDTSAGAEGVVELIENLSVAFGTSIAGLIAAIIITLLANAMRTSEQALLARQERLASQVQVLCKNNLGEDDGIARTAKELQRQLNHNREDLIATRNAMQDRTQDLRDAATSLSENTKAPADHLVGHMSDLSDLLEKLRTTLQETSRLADRVAQSEANTIDGINDLLKSVTERQNTQIQDLIERQVTGMESSQTMMAERLTGLETAMAGAIDRIVSNIDSLAKNAVTSQAEVSLSVQSRAFEEAAASAFAEQRAMLNRHGFWLLALYVAGIGGVVTMALFSSRVTTVAPALPGNSEIIETEVTETDPVDSAEPEALEEQTNDAPALEQSIEEQDVETETQSEQEETDQTNDE